MDKFLITVESKGDRENEKAFGGKDHEDNAKAKDLRREEGAAMMGEGNHDKGKRKVATRNAADQGMPKPTIMRQLQFYRCFVDNGFANWKKALQSFQSHDKSEYHRASLSALATSEKDKVSSMLVTGRVKQMKDNRVALAAIFTSKRYLGRQGLARRGHIKENSNLEVLLEEQRNEIAELNSWLKIEEKAHKLNLAVQDAMIADREIRDIMLLVQELTAFIRGSPKRLPWFSQFKDTNNESQARSLRPFVQPDGQCVEGGSSSLQGTQLSFCKSEKVKRCIRQSVKDARTDGRFSNLWQSILSTVELNENVDEPRLPRQPKVPRRIFEGSGNAFYPATAKEHYRPKYFGILDSVFVGLTERFEPDETSQHLRKVEKLLIGEESSVEYIS
eukprot:gene911-216_t